MLNTKCPVHVNNNTRKSLAGENVSRQQCTVRELCSGFLDEKLYPLYCSSAAESCDSMLITFNG
jgi:hypothetical protein